MEAKKKIVILDDDAPFAALLTTSLEDEFEVVAGSNGLQGIEYCLDGGVSAVITDIGMPELDGIGMLKEFQRRPELASIPVLVVTATLFSRLDRRAVLQFPQVKKIILKTADLDGIIAEVKAVLREAGQWQ